MSYLKTILLGTLGSTENWSVGVAWRNFELFAADMTQPMVESLAARLVTGITTSAVPTALKALLSTNAAITGWRVEQHNEDESLRNVAQASYTTAVAGSGSPTKTPQDAIVFSLRTSTPGARGRGRLYWPALGAALSTEFALTNPTPATAAAAAAQLLKLIGDQINLEWAQNSIPVTTELCVRSLSDHQSRKVERLQVGSALDTQRRRRDKIIETYAVVNYPPA